ncbi:MAG: beta-galactosidase trimerization domain-containing protein [Planctomycetota bacterium]|nr:beta-galactosidase trimerization domain-containing protein [Planctomycetota bacterium]
MRSLLFVLLTYLAAIVPIVAEANDQPFDGSDELAVLALAEAEPAQLLARVRELEKHYHGRNSTALFALLMELVKRAESTVKDEDLLKEPLGATFEHQALHVLLDILYQWPDEVLLKEVASRLTAGGGTKTVTALMAARAVSAQLEATGPLKEIAVSGNSQERVLALLALGESGDAEALTLIDSRIGADNPSVRQAALVARHRLRLSLGRVNHGAPAIGPALSGILPIGRGSNIGGGYDIPTGEIETDGLALIVMRFPDSAASFDSQQFGIQLKKRLAEGATLLLINDTGAAWPEQVMRWSKEHGVSLPTEAQMTAGTGVPAYADFRSFCDFPYELREQADDAASHSWKFWGNGQTAPIRSAKTGGALFVVQEGVFGKGRVVFTTVSLGDHDVYRENFLRWVFGEALLQRLAGYKAPLFQMDPSGKTPHVPWHKPGSGESVSLIWAAGKSFKRTLPEMVQRMDVDWSFVPYTAFFDRPVRTKETLGVRTLIGQRAMEIFEQELFRKEVFVLSYGEVDLGSLVHSRPAVVGMKSLPARLRRQLLRRVRQGAGLVVLGQHGVQFSLEIARQEWDAFGEEDDSFRMQAGLILPFETEGAEEALLARRVGKGRAVWFCRNLPSDFILQDMPRPPDPPVAFSVPALEGTEVRIRPAEYDYALLVKSLLWAAGRDSASTIKEMALSFPAAGEPGQVELQLTRPLKGKLNIQLRSAYDEIVLEKEIESSGDKILAELVPLGRGGFVAEFRLLDEQGKGVDFAARRFSVESDLQIHSIDADKQFYKEGEDVRVKVAMKGIASLAAKKEVMLSLSAVDSFGRQVFTQRVSLRPDNTELNISVPVRTPLSRLLELRISLESDGHQLDHFRKPVGVDLGVAELDFDVEAPVPDSLAEMFKNQFGVDTAIAAPLTGMRHQFNFGLGSWAHPVGPLITSSSRTDPKVRVPCFSDPATRLRALLDARELHKTYGPLGVRHYMMADECTHGMCESEHCLFRFRRKMRQEYGSLEQLNLEWQSDFDSWQSVVPFTNDGSSAEALGRWIDYQWFNEWVFAEYCNFIEMACEDTMPGLMAGHSGRSGRSLLMHLSRLFYYYGVSERDVSIARPGSVIGSWYAPGYRFVENHETQCRQWPWWHLLRGTNKMCLWYAKLGSPAIHGDLSRPYMAFVWLKEEMDDLKRGMGKLLLHCKRDEGRAAEYTSLRSDMVKNKMKEFNLAPLKRSDFAGLCLPLQEECRYVSELMVEQGALEERPIKLLFLPAIVSLSSKERTSIKDFVKRGGVVVADYGVGTRNEHGTKLDDTFARELFGCALTESKEEVSKAGEGLSVRLLNDGPVPLKRLSTSGPLKVETWGAHLQLAGGKCALVISQDIPALVINRYGKGMGIYLNFNLNTLTGDVGNAPSLLAEDLLALAGIQPVFGVKVSGETLLVDFGVFNDGGAFYTGFVQRGKGGMLADEQQAQCEITFRRKAHLYDARAGKYLGLTDAHSALLTPSIAQLYASLPYRLEQITIEGAESSKRGELLKFDVRLHTEGVKAVQHVLLFKVIDPAGNPMPAHEKRMLVKNGQCTLEIPVALNAPEGKWRISVRDAGTGVVRASEFVVE